MSLKKYLDRIESNSRQAIKVEWLNRDESVNFEFSNQLYNINVDLNVNYQNGSRRSCTLTLNNDKNQFPINFNNIWIGQKFKLWMGIYIDENTPYYFPQGVFYISNPKDVYQPSTKTIQINGVDKWAFLDGTLNGVLSGTYKTNVGTNLYEATKKLLSLHMGNDMMTNIYDIENYFNKTDDKYCFKYVDGVYKSNNEGNASSTATTTLVAKYDMHISFNYCYSTESGYDKFTLSVGDKIIESNVSGDSGVKTYSCDIYKNQKIIFQYTKDGSGNSGLDCAWFYNFKSSRDSEMISIDPVAPLFSPHLLKKKTTVPIWDDNTQEYKNIEHSIINCPYTAIVERGNTYADILLEYATILCANIYYDVNGRLTIEPVSDEIDDMLDTNKEVVWHYSVDEKSFLGLTQTYNFDKVYNDIIVLGNVVNGKQFKARVQNRNIMSDTCVQKIGLKTKKAIEDNQYYSDKQCEKLAKYYAKIDTILKKSGDIESLPLYHIDVNKIVTVSTPNNNMSRELFLITGYTINSLQTMSVSVTSVNSLSDFSVVEVV